LASPGATVIDGGQIRQISSLVPARGRNGACLFLDEESRCRIHSVSPFGCSRFDHHQTNEEASRRSNAAYYQIDLAWKSNDLAVEKLKVKGMVKNHHLAKSISDAGWKQFIVILTSKAESAGRVVVPVNPSSTSQECARCESRVRKTLATREHRCVKCGFVTHRDHNAALNIEKRGALASGMVSVGEPCEPRISTYNAALGV
jgi:IS605 OrfB family transposase